MKKLKLLDTFAGIGGFSYAAEKLVGGFETTQFIEINPYCQKVLNKHWSHVPIHDDITTFTAKSGEFDIITGGFPCQDISVAGLQKGITKETRGLDIVLRELYEAGYDAEWAVISASSLGACHQRSRWWLVAYPNNLQRFDLLRQKSKQEQEKLKGVGNRTDGSANASNTQNKRLQRTSERGVSRERLWPNPSRYNQTTPNSFSTRTQIQYEQRRSSVWTMPSSYGKKGSTLSRNWQAYESKPCLCRGDDGLSNWTHRLKALGNSVVPQVAAIPMQRILDIEKNINK